MPIAKKTVRRPVTNPTRKQKAHAKANAAAKAAARNPPKPRRKAMPAPGGAPGQNAKEYLAMTKVVLEVLPGKGPGLAVGEVYDAVRRNTSHKDFPGDTHRMWAKQVLLDLKAKGILHEASGSPAKWRKL